MITDISFLVAILVCTLIMLILVMLDSKFANVTEFFYAI
jgi:hypothetical protein